MIRSRWFGFFLLLMVAILVASVVGPVVQGEDPPDVLTIDPGGFGISFINSAETLRSEARIRRGVEAGAQLDRFPFYWDRIEPSEGQFEWTRQDAALRANEAQGLGTLAILIGTPPNYWHGSEFVPFSAQIPNVEEGLREMLSKGEEVARSCSAESIPPAAGLYHPIFADGSDEPAADKAINPENPWARFVGQTVERYRPGGTAGLHVRYWEIWNEPDLCHFWRGTALDYARLLKVAYLVIKNVDPEATVLWGGLALYGPKYEGGANFLDELVVALQNDPLAASHNGFFDAPAIHQYSTVAHSSDNARRVQSALAGTGWEEKPIWVTESGVPICDSYPGPSCDVTHYRASAEEQAAYIWQNIAMTRVATWPNVAPIFHFQLYDDAGNECRSEGPADGFGLITNEPDSPCTPHNAEARLAYTAYQLAAQYLAGTQVLWEDIEDGMVRRVAFYDAEMQERRTLVWAIDGRDGVANVPATADSARLIGIDGREQALTPVDGAYEIALSHATNQNLPDDPTSYTIGGKPYMLIEKDTQPPTGIIKELTPLSASTFSVEWDVNDEGSGLTDNSATVWVYAQKDGQGEWDAWLTEQPATGSATFNAEAGVRYHFAVLATDQAGNNGTKIERLVNILLDDHLQVARESADVQENDNDNVEVASENQEAQENNNDNLQSTPESAEEQENKNDNVEVTPESTEVQENENDNLESTPESAEARENDNDNVDVTPESAEAQENDNLQIVPVSGYVQNTRQQPAAWAKVAIGEVSAIANEDGYFTLDVPLGEWDVMVQDDLQISAQRFFTDSNLLLQLLPENNPVVNGNFESDLTAWQPSGSNPLAVEEMADSDDHALRLGTAFVADPNVPGADGPATGGNSTISQTVRIPDGNPVLSLLYKVESEETDGGNGSCADRANILHDRFEIIIDKEGDPANYILCQDTASQWRYDSFDLSAYAGQQINLIINVYETSPNLRTNALIDQIVIGESPQLPQPEPTATPTITPTHTPAPSATATHTPAPSATATHTPAPSATHTPAPTATPTHTPTGTEARGLNTTQYIYYIPLLSR
ncbi:MAG: hypothetical protein ACPGWR_23650 [Ardenticatenaceae bacterium]